LTEARGYVGVAPEAVVGTIELENAGSHRNSHLQAPADVGPVAWLTVEKSTS
jgi:hypothetical protein